MGDVLDLKALLSKILTSLTTHTETFTITRTSGASITGTPTAYIIGKMCQIRFDLIYSISVASGSNIFVGTLPSKYAPVSRIVGTSYYGNGVIALDINPSGQITVRNASDHAITISGGIILSIQYTLGGGLERLRRFLPQFNTSLWERGCVVC